MAISLQRQKKTEYIKFWRGGKRSPRRTMQSVKAVKNLKLINQRYMVGMSISLHYLTAVALNEYCTKNYVVRSELLRNFVIDGLEKMGRFDKSILIRKISDKRIHVKKIDDKVKQIEKFKKIHSIKMASQIKTKHNLCKSKTYKRWAYMRSKCNNPKQMGYKNCGGKGIKVCRRWDGPMKFPNFLEDMGECPPNKTSLKRKNILKDFTKSNCYWGFKE